MKWAEANMATGLYITQNGSVMVSYGPKYIPISSAEYKANGYKPPLERLVAKPFVDSRPDRTRPLHRRPCRRDDVGATIE
jgi:hypothetical protein